MAVSVASPLHAAEPADVDTRLKLLEARWDRMEAELAAIRGLIERNQGAVPAPAAESLAAVSETVNALGDDLEAIRGDVTTQGQALLAAGAARQRDIAISAYGAVNASKRSGRDSLIDAESFEMVLSGQPHEQISFFSEIEFERAASVGAERGGEVLVEQSYVDMALTDSLSLRGGVILVPFGNNEADHYAPLRDVIYRPLSSRLIAPTDWTDNGFGLVGHREFEQNWQLDWEAYLIAGLDDQIGFNGLRGARQGFGEDNNNDKAFAGHLTLRNSDDLSVGLGIYTGAYDNAGDHQLSGWGVDFNWRHEGWKFAGEYLDMRAERADAEADAANMRGGYARAGYDVNRWFSRNWSGEYFPDARLSLIYEFNYVSIEDLTSPTLLVGRERKHVLGWRYEPDHSWILKVNREWSDASGRPLINGDADGWAMGVGFVF
ncbi:MAG TPA: hypothetical protein PLQ74_10515 [Pseudomonadota bacterium]|nr:hypothetical protein [Pseudomonadota bacterium]